MVFEDVVVGCPIACQVPSVTSQIQSCRSIYFPFSTTDPSGVILGELETVCQ